VQAHWKTFLADLEANAESPLPAFIAWPRSRRSSSAESWLTDSCASSAATAVGAGRAVDLPSRAAPTDDEVAGIVGAVLRKVGKKLARVDDVAEAAAVADEPLLAGCSSPSRTCSGARRLSRVRRAELKGRNGHAMVASSAQ
jgi:hypothetical protein